MNCTLRTLAESRARARTYLCLCTFYPLEPSVKSAAADETDGGNGQVLAAANSNIEFTRCHASDSTDAYVTFLVPLSFPLAIVIVLARYPTRGIRGDVRCERAHETRVALAVAKMLR